MEEHAIRHAEHSGVHADAESQRQNDYSAEAWIPAQHPQPVTRVLKQRFGPDYWHISHANSPPQTNCTSELVWEPRRPPRHGLTKSYWARCIDTGDAARYAYFSR